VCNREISGKAAAIGRELAAHIEGTPWGKAKEPKKQDNTVEHDENTEGNGTEGESFIPF